MSAACSECSKNIAGVSRQCSTCQRSFYPACCKAYLLYRSAKPCCIDSLSLISDYSNSAACTMTSATALVSFVVLNSNNKPSGQPSQPLPPVTASPGRSVRDPLLAMSASLNAFIMKQSSVNEELTAKLNNIQKHTQLLETHTKQIIQLEVSNAQLVKENAEIRRELSELRASIGTSSAGAPLPSTCEITISGILSSVCDPP